MFLGNLLFSLFLTISAFGASLLTSASIMQALEWPLGKSFLGDEFLFIAVLCYAFIMVVIVLCIRYYEQCLHTHLQSDDWRLVCFPALPVLLVPAMSYGGLSNEIIAVGLFGYMMFAIYQALAARDRAKELKERPDTAHLA